MWICETINCLQGFGKKKVCGDILRELSRLGLGAIEKVWTEPENCGEWFSRYYTNWVTLVLLNSGVLFRLLIATVNSGRQSFSKWTGICVCCVSRLWIPRCKELSKASATAPHDLYVITYTLDADCEQQRFNIQTFLANELVLLFFVLFLSTHFSHPAHSALWRTAVSTIMRMRDSTGDQFDSCKSWVTLWSDKRIRIRWSLVWPRLEFICSLAIRSQVYLCLLRMLLGLETERWQHALWTSRTSTGPTMVQTSCYVGKRSADGNEGRPRQGGQWP